MRALLYADLNPVRAGLLGRAGEYPWSSARAHLDGVDRSGILDLANWDEICPLNDWGDALMGMDAGAELRAATQAGNPDGDEGFVTQLERQAGWSLRLKPPGPQPKARATGA